MHLVKSVSYRIKSNTNSNANLYRCKYVGGTDTYDLLKIIGCKRHKLSTAVPSQYTSANVEVI